MGDILDNPYPIGPNADAAEKRLLKMKVKSLKAEAERSKDSLRAAKLEKKIRETDAATKRLRA